MTKKALITGVTGQDGSYLAELLLEKGYEVYGLVRRSSHPNLGRIEHLIRADSQPSKGLQILYGDLGDSSCLCRIVGQIKPDEIYNLAAQSHVKVSFDIPEYTGDVTGLGTVRVLEAIRENGLESRTKFYQASSSELYGKVIETPQTELTPFNPRSPYAVAKAYSYYMTKNYREAYGMFATNGILFNHESPRRGEDFVTRKITRALARIKFGLQEKLHLGNLDAKRDWGYAKDYVEAMWLMLQASEADDFVVATGETHSIREFLDLAADFAGMDWKKYVVVDSRFFRPAEVDLLLGDPSKATRLLGWKPRVTFEGLVKLMMDSDLQQTEQFVHGLNSKSKAGRHFEEERLVASVN